jgi:hypothetical protein
MNVNRTSAIGDVEYFFRLQFGDTVHSLALVSVFSPPDQELLELSHRAVYVCHHGGIDALVIVDVKAIKEVVAMVPDYEVTVEGDIVTPENRFSLVESPFLKLAALSGSLVEDDAIENITETVD